MIAKIGRGSSIMGALSYNYLKVERGEGRVLCTNMMRHCLDGDYTLSQLFRSFEPYLMANKRTEKPSIHISLNPDPRDKLSDDTFQQIAEEYMKAMGYGNQPYVVFKHTDTSRTHIHIVSTCVDRSGKKIPDTYEKLRSMEHCRSLEAKFNLMVATEAQRTGKESMFRPVDYRAGDIKSQIAAVVRYLPNQYQFQGLGTYNALLSLFNIQAEEVRGDRNGEQWQGLVYFALSEMGQRVSNPFKASLFGKNAGLPELQLRFEQSKLSMKTNTVRGILKNTIEMAMHISKSEEGFKKDLLAQGINTVIRRNDQHRIYGITFIDHESKTVWNGSQLDKNLSANTFNDFWNNNIKPAIGEPFMVQPILSTSNDGSLPTEESHFLFDFLISDKHADGLIEALGGLLPAAEGEDYEEQVFANKMKKKRKRKRGQ